MVVLGAIGRSFCLPPPACRSSLRRAFLAAGRCHRECGTLLALGHDAVDGRDVRHLDLEQARDDDDAGQADVGDGHAVAVAEDAGLGVVREPLLDCLQAGREPVNLPGAPGDVVELSLRGQVFLDTWREQRVGVGGPIVNTMIESLSLPTFTGKIFPSPSN